MKLVCRKCNGNHLTIKCDKNKNLIIEESKYKVEKSIQENQGMKNHNKNKIYKVKITDLPNDIKDEELMELLYEWGDIIYLKIINYKETSIAYIYFKYEEQADYFIKALDKTKFEYLIINVKRI